MNKTPRSTLANSKKPCRKRSPSTSGWHRLAPGWFCGELVRIARAYDSILDVDELRKALKHRQFDLHDHEYFFASFCERQDVERDDLGQPSCWRDDHVALSAENVERARLEIALIRLRIARIKSMSVDLGPVPAKKAGKADNWLAGVLRSENQK